MLRDKINRHSKNICWDKEMLSDKLPEDLMEEIIVRLPVKSLLRFKCVSKSWYALITDPLFITKQLEWSTSITKNRGLNVFFHKRHHNIPYSLSLISISEEPYMVQDLEFPFPKNDLEHISAYGQRDGIFYFLRESRCFQDIMLCNLTTKEVKVIPMPLRIREHRDSLRIGFGFDPTTKDYKIVCFQNSRWAKKQLLVEVYNLSTNSWRIIDVNVVRGESFSSCLKGVCHWVVVDDDDDDEHIDKSFILTFDFGKEVFMTIQLPPVIQPVEAVNTVDEKLALLVTKDWGEEFEIWVMNEYGVESSWTKKFETGPLPPNAGNISLFWGAYNILVEETDGRFVSYNNFQNQQRHITLGLRLIYWTRMSDYIESLVPLMTQRGQHKREHDEI